MSQPFVPIWEEYRQGERDFRKLYLAEADLQAAIMPEIILEEADLRGANLSGANLSGARLRKVDFTHANLKEALLVGADLREATLAGANLSGANLTGARLDKAFLRLANFSHADLTNASLVDVDGRGWLVTDAEKHIAIQRTSFQEAVLRGANLTDAYLRLGNFRGADLSGTIMVSADFTSIDAAPILTNEQKPVVAVFQNADLSLACLNNANISYCDFRKAKLTGADLRQTSIGGSFKEADLSQAIFYETEVVKCDLTGANLMGTNLEGCKFSQVRMPDGQPPGKNFERFTGPPPNLGSQGGVLRQVNYTEFWFETYEEIKALSWPRFCVCCSREYDRFERTSHESVEGGVLKVYEVRVPYCTACLQHGVRTHNVKAWLKPSCASQGGSLPAFKFEVKSKLLSSKVFFVLSFASPEYLLGFASGNALPMKGLKGNW